MENLKYRISDWTITSVAYLIAVIAMTLAAVGAILQTLFGQGG